MAKIHVFIEGPDTIHRISLDERECPAFLLSVTSTMRDIGGGEFQFSKIVAVIKGDGVESMMTPPAGESGIGIWEG